MPKQTKELQRIPRPLAVTMLMRQGDTIRGQQYVVQSYIASNFTYLGKRMSLPEFSQTTGINIQFVLEKLSQITSNSSFLLDNKKAITDASRVLISNAINWGLTDRNLAENQAVIMLKSQGGKYKPFVSTAANEALRTAQSATRALLDIYKTLATPEILKEVYQSDQKQEAQYLTVESAVGLLQTGQNTPHIPEGLKHNLLGPVPNIIAIQQEDYKPEDLASTKGLPEPSSELITHNNRREEGLGLTEE
jgi:hypothetical protein